MHPARLPMLCAHMGYLMRSSPNHVEDSVLPRGQLRCSRVILGIIMSIVGLLANNHTVDHILAC